MESPLLERQHLILLPQAPRPLGKDPERDPLALHVLPDVMHHLDGIFAVLTVDHDGSG